LPVHLEKVAITKLGLGSDAGVVQW
jgi:hypothetical protein